MWVQKSLLLVDDEELIDLWTKIPEENRKECIRMFAELVLSFAKNANENGEKENEI